jgi:predicted small secreted protein
MPAAARRRPGYDGGCGELGQRDASIAWASHDVLNQGGNQATVERPMNNARTAVTAILVISSLFLWLPGCQKAEGPAERAGKGIDKAVEGAGQQLEKAGQQIQDAAKDAKK